MARSTLRFDYLFWDIQDGGNAILGGSTTSTADLSGQDTLNRLPAVDLVSGVRANTFAIVPNQTQFPMDDNSGARGVWALPTTEGTLELELWALAKIDNTLNIAPRVDSQTPGLPLSIIPAVTLLSNGTANATTMILFSDSYAASLKTTLWGTGADWVFNPFVPNLPLTVSPILGFRYIQLQERQDIRGQDTSGGVTLNHVIASLARNDVFGPQIGLQFATHHGRFDISVAPRIMLGINRVKNSVNTDQIISVLEAPRNVTETNTEFAPVFDLALYSRIQVTQHFALFAGYDLLVGHGFSRAFDNIVYDSPSVLTDPSTIRPREDDSIFFAHGLMVGGEISFR